MATKGKTHASIVANRKKSKPIMKRVKITKRSAVKRTSR